MNYEPGDFICVNSKGKSPGGRFTEAAIRYLTKSEYDHVFIAVHDGKIIEAEPHGVGYAEIAKYDGCDMIVSTTQLSLQQRTQVIEMAHKFIGVPYNYLDIVYLGLELTGLKSDWLLRQVLDQRSMICSQLVAQAGFNADIQEWLCNKQYAQLVTPGDLARLAATTLH